ncbi:hypothetical protein Tco_0844230 [Tanacetum coccineum]
MPGGSGSTNTEGRWHQRCMDVRKDIYGTAKPPLFHRTEEKRLKIHSRIPEGIKGNVTSSKPATLHDAINMARELIEQGVQAKALRIVPAKGRGSLELYHSAIGLPSATRIPEWKWEKLAIGLLSQSCLKAAVEALGTRLYMKVQLTYPQTDVRVSDYSERGGGYAFEPVLPHKLKCAPFEALYWRKLDSPIIVLEVGESQLIGPEIVQETTEKIFQIKERLKTARSRQKSYADKRRKPLESKLETECY